MGSYSTQLGRIYLGIYRMSLVMGYIYLGMGLMFLVMGIFTRDGSNIYLVMGHIYLGMGSYLPLRMVTTSPLRSEPVKGTRRQVSSYSTQPAAHMSLLWLYLHYSSRSRTRFIGKSDLNLV